MAQLRLERHRTDRIGWLRAAVLGANDGLISTGSLVVGVAAAGSPRGEVLLAAVAGLVAGALAMGATALVGRLFGAVVQPDLLTGLLLRRRICSCWLRCARPPGSKY